MGILRNWFSSSRTSAQERAVESVTAVILSRSLIDAQLLLMIAAERAIPLEERIVRAIVATEDAFQKGLVTAETSVRFWQAYEALSRALSPISIDSVRATHGFDRLKSGLLHSLKSRAGSPFTQKSVFHYKLLALATLLALIVLQIFWSIGNNLVTDIREQTDQIAALESRILDMSQPSGDKAAATQTEIHALRQQIASLKSWRDAEVVEL